jgi:hypothetical protein
MLVAGLSMSITADWTVARAGVTGGVCGETPFWAALRWAACVAGLAAVQQPRASRMGQGIDDLPDETNSMKPDRLSRGRSGLLNRVRGLSRRPRVTSLPEMERS